MKWTQATLAVLSTGMILLGGRALLVPAHATPEEILEDVRQRTARPGFDPQRVLRDLGRAIDDPLSAGRRQLMADLLDLRAGTLVGLERYGEARADLQRILAFEPEDTALALRVHELTALEGNVEGAWEEVWRMVADDPGLHDGWRLAGRLERQLARAKVAQARGLCDSVLVARAAERAGELVVELAGRDPKDGARLQLTGELRGLLLPAFRDELRQVLSLTEVASGFQAEARRAFARSFAGDVEAETLEELVELYREAGQPELAAELGTAARLLPQVGSSEDLALALLRAVVDLGQHSRAQGIVQSWPWSRVGAREEFCLEALEVLRETGSWRRMGPVVAELFRHTPDRARTLANLYGGLNSLATERWPTATAGLIGYINGKERSDPFEGARGFAWAQLARAYRGRANPAAEHDALLRALSPPRAEAAEGWFAHIGVEDFLRYAELALETRNAGFREPELILTRGLAMLPRHTSELVGRWEEIGRLALKGEGHELQVVLDNMRIRRRMFPDVESGPWTLYQAGLAHLEGGNHAAAVGVARSLLKSYENLVPALDVLIRAQIAQLSYTQAAGNLLRRLELAGPDEITSELVARLGPEAFDGDRMVRLVRGDPAGTGRLAVARHLLEAGSPGRALLSVGPGDGEDPEADPPRVRLLRARALVDLGRHGEAARALEGLLEHPALAAEALVVLVEARLGAGDREGARALVETLVERFATAERRPRQVALEVVDQLLAGGQAADAGLILDALDAHPVTRGGEVLRRMVLHRALIGDRAGALETLERAEAFLADGTVEIVRLLFAVEDRDWTALPRLVADLRATEFPVSPLQDAILTLLGEDLEAGMRKARLGLGASPHSAEWALVQAAALLLEDGPLELPDYFGPTAAEQLLSTLRGRDRASRDPRGVLALLLALDRPGWALWVAPRVVELSRLGGGVLWPTYLGGRIFSALGQTDQARTTYQALTLSHPRFGPGWDALETLVRSEVDDAWNARVLGVRRDRLGAMGPQGRSALTLAMDEAAGEYLSGDLGAAAARLRRAFDRQANRSHPGHAFLARVLALLGSFEESLAEYRLATAAERPSSQSRVVREYVSVLMRAWRPNVSLRRRVPGPAVKAALEALENRFPDDPLVPLERARLATELESRNPDLSVVMVENLYRAFRERTHGVALDRLRPGSAVAWGEFLLSVSPAQAEDMLAEELALVPGDLDLWRLRVAALVRRGRVQEAVELAGALSAMSSESEVQLAYAELLVQTGGPKGQIERVLTDVEKDPTTSPALRTRVRFVRAQAQLRSPSPPQSLSRSLAAMWDRRRRLKGIDPVLLGRGYFAALLRRHRAEDLEQAAEVLEVLARSPAADVYERDLVTALGGILAHLEPAPEPPPKEGAPGAKGTEGTGESEGTEAAGGSASHEPPDD